MRLGVVTSRVGLTRRLILLLPLTHMAFCLVFSASCLKAGGVSGRTLSIQARTLDSINNVTTMKLCVMENVSSPNIKNPKPYATTYKKKYTHTNSRFFESPQTADASSCIYSWIHPIQCVSCSGDASSTYPHNHPVARCR